jgi:hypothetical protein
MIILGMVLGFEGTRELLFLSAEEVGNDREGFDIIERSGTFS